MQDFLEIYHLTLSVYSTISRIACFDEGLRLKLKSSLWNFATLLITLSDSKIFSQFWVFKSRTLCLNEASGFRKGSIFKLRSLSLSDEFVMNCFLDITACGFQWNSLPFGDLTLLCLDMSFLYSLVSSVLSFGEVNDKDSLFFFFNVGLPSFFSVIRLMLPKATELFEACRPALL